MRKYCEICGKEVEAKTITQKESFEVCGDSVEVDAHVLVCAECGEELFCEEYDSATLNHAYSEYRRRHKLLSPEEIKKIREQYGLSQRGFAKLLNWGDKTIRRYENGSIQDKAHNSLLVFLRDPENMRTYLTENEILFDEKQKAKLLDTVDKLEKKSEYRTEMRLFERFFAQKSKGLPAGVLSDEEVKVLERIFEKFKSYSTIDISDHSHKESGYSSTKDGEILSYAYAKDFNMY